MKKINIFLASSKELLSEREYFEREIYRKCKVWFERGVFLHLDIWEDLSARMTMTGSQSQYNQFVRTADLFVLLAYTKVGMYTAEEFDAAFGQFRSTQKPFIFTYFKASGGVITDSSLTAFQQKLSELKHFYSTFRDQHDLWLQFNKELDRLEADRFEEFKHNNGNHGNRMIIQGEKSVYIEKPANDIKIKIQ